MLGSPPLYSVDASALIEMERVYGRIKPMWDFVGSLGEQHRLFVAQSVKDDCSGDRFSAWFARYPSLVVPYSDELGRYYRALMDDLARVRLRLVNTESTKSLSDPQVIALALMLEGRDVADLHEGAQRPCHVICYEGSRRGTTGHAKMRDVCQHYNISYLHWQAFQELENWSI